MYSLARSTASTVAPMVEKAAVAPAATAPVGYSEEQSDAPHGADVNQRDIRIGTDEWSNPDVTAKSSRRIATFSHLCDPLSPVGRIRAASGAARHKRAP